MVPFASRTAVRGAFWLVVAAFSLSGCGAGAAPAAGSTGTPPATSPPASSAAGASAAAGASQAASASAGSSSAAPSLAAQSSPAAATAGASSSSTSVASQASAGADWPTYHRDNARAGVGPDQPPLASPKQAWSAKVDGAVYGEPLIVGNRVYVVTENDSAYALDANTGTVVWQKHVGEAVPRSALPCGNIDPSGFTATPVIDVARKELYAVGRFQPAHHELWVFDLDSGAEKYHRTVDPQGTDPRYLQDRSAVTLAGGKVFVSFGGNFGDCGPYKGWVVSAPEGDSSGALTTFAVPTQREGAIWAPPGPAVDSNGDLLVATGNAESAGDFDYANAVIRLGPDLKMKDYWAPSDWKALSASDTDIGSVSPSLLQANQTFQIGKAGVGYLLKTDNLGKIGGEIYQQKICNGAFGGNAYQPPMLYVPCTNALLALRVQAGKFDVAWQATAGRLNSPIVAYGSVWTVDTNDAVLYQLNPADGSVRNKLQLPGPTVAHFLTPSAAGGKVFVSSGANVLAFGA